MARRTCQPGDSALASRLRRELEGEVLFDALSRGQYSTDASIYQIEPIGVVVPHSEQDIVAAIGIAAEESVPVLMRGAGTSQCGQTVGRSLVLDTSKYLRNLLTLDTDTRRVTVQPGIVLDQLNARLKPHGLFFPVDVSTASRATIGGMAGNNSCGSRSIRYGNMVHNVHAIEAVLHDGEVLTFAHTPPDLAAAGSTRYRELVQELRAIAVQHAAALESRWPKLLRRVGGYNIDTLSGDGHNMAQMLVGSEGTLAAYTRITLDLAPIPRHKVLGVCHFPSFYAAMDSTRHIVELGPSAVELVDRTMIDLARDIPMYRDAVDQFVQGEPQALLLVEFSGDEEAPQRHALARLIELMASLGFSEAVVQATEPAIQAAVWEVRKAGLNIMMSMKGDGKPVSFIEDCAVALEDLAEYTDRLTEVFSRHGTTGTWYAHASVGCLHVRPVLNMKDEGDVRKMRQIAEEAFAMVREYKGSHSGEHGDGLVRSEFHQSMFGPEISGAYETVKDQFDPPGLFNPGKIVRAPRMDDRSLFRYKPGYRTEAVAGGLDWSPWKSFAGAVEMCNNNGACRKSNPDVMCPSYRATGDERHLTRGRANGLRLALSGQLGENALTSDALYDTMALCIGCKGCRRECPTGVDMARMKIEFLYHYHQRHPLRVRDKLIAWLPRYAPLAARAAPLMNARNRVPGLARLGERLTGLSAKRRLPRWRRDYFRAPQTIASDGHEPADGDVMLFVDTFNTWFEPENAHAAYLVLSAAGYRVQIARAPDGTRPLCCGRTFLSVGLIDEARREAERLIAALTPALERGTPVIGLEPSCLYTLRDELVALLPGEPSRRLAEQAMLLEEFLAAERRSNRLRLNLRPIAAKRALLHGHCHQKAFDAMPAVESALGLVPELDVQTIASGCCGMAGAFGYDARHVDVSLRIGELDLLPRVREASPDTLLVADGTSCRAQIQHGTGREAQHVARVLADALADTEESARGRPEIVSD